MRSIVLSKSLVIGAVLGALLGCNAASNSATEGASAEASRLNVENRSLPIQNGTNTVSALAAGVPSLTLVASIAPPLVGGLPLQANSATSNLTSIYVSYNLAGVAAGGGVDQIDVSLLGIPALSSSLQFPTLDVNNVNFINGALFVAGNSSVADAPARLQKFTTPLLGGIGSLVSDVALPGYAATSIDRDLLAANIYVTTGDNSGLQAVNGADLSLGTYVAIPDARAVSVTTLGSVYVVSGNDSGGIGWLRGFDTALNPLGAVNLGDTGVAQAKSTIVTGANYGLATAGSGGLRLICLGNMTVVGSAPAPTGGVTNAAVFTGGFIFSADGADGVTVYAVNQGLPVVGYATCNHATLTKLGTINFGTSVSANNISVFGGYLVVSGGLGGFKLVSLTLPTLLTGLITSL